MKFPIVIHKDPGSDYGVSIPDVPGCFSAGETVEEAMDNAREALALHFGALLADGDHLPYGSSIDTWLSDTEYAGGVWAIVDFDITPYLGKSIRFNATLPEHLLNRIDDYVKNHPEQKSRSGFLASAALRVLSKGNP